MGIYRPIPIWWPIYRASLLCMNHMIKMAPSMATVLRAPRKLCSFSYVLFIFLSSLPDELNTFYARFKADNTAHTESAPAENKNTYVRMLFVDYSSVFNTIVPATLVAKLQTLGLNRSLCSWILDFLTGRSQVVRMGNNLP